MDIRFEMILSLCLKLVNFAISSYHVIALIIFLNLILYLQKFRKSNKPSNIPHLSLLTDEKSTNRILTEIIKSDDKYHKIGSQNYIILSTAAHIQDFFQSTKGIRKPDAFQAAFVRVFGSSALTSNDQEWKRKRQVLLPTVNGKKLKSFVPVITKQSESLISDLRKYVGTKEFDLLKYLSQTTFKIFTDSTEIGAIPPNSSLQLVNTVVRMLSTALDRMMETEGSIAASEQLHGKEIHEFRSNMRLLLNQLIENGTKFSKNETNLADERIGMNYVEAAQQLAEESADEDVVLNELLIAITGGIVNTSTTIGFFLLMIAMHQDTQEKIYAELCDTLNDKSSIDLEDIQKLSELDKALKETLRFFTLVPLIFRTSDQSRLTGSKSEEYENTVISIIGVHFNETYYKNPWKFDPEHFNPEATKLRPKYAFIPFGFGSRECLGKAYALVIMKIILINLLRTYSFHTTKRIEDLKLNYGYLITSKNGYNVEIRLRKTD